MQVTLLLIALIQPVEIDEDSAYQVARRGLQREVIRYHARIRVRERQIANEPDDARADAMRRRLEKYKRKARALLEKIWQEVELMRLQEQPKPRRFPEVAVLCSILVVDSGRQPREC